MSVYVAMINDRHTDPTPYVFSTPAAAIECARGYAEEAAARHGGCQVEEESVADWLYYARFCTEGDDVWLLNVWRRCGRRADLTESMNRSC